MDPVAIDRLLAHDQIDQVREGLRALCAWVEAQEGEPDFGVFGYRGGGEALAANPLFDGMLDRHQDALTPNDLLLLVDALFRGDGEDFERAALVTALRRLLDGADEALQRRWVRAVQKGLSGYEHGHRPHEQRFVDVLLGELVSKLDPPAATELLEWAADGLLAWPDDLAALLVATLERKPPAALELRLATRATRFFYAHRDALDEQPKLKQRFSEVRARLSPDNQQRLDGVRAAKMRLGDLEKLIKRGTTDLAGLSTALQALADLSSAELKMLEGEPFYKALRVQATKLSIETTQTAVERLLTRNPDAQNRIVVHVVRYALGFHHKKMVAFITRLAQSASNGAAITEVVKRARVWNPLGHPMVVRGGELVQSGKNVYAGQDFNDAAKATIDKNLDAVLARLAPPA